MGYFSYPNYPMHPLKQNHLSCNYNSNRFSIHGPDYRTGVPFLYESI